MTRETSKAIASLLEDLAQRYPDLRFGQLVVMVSTLAGEVEPKETYDLDDEAFIRTARDHLSRRSQALPNHHGP